MATHRIFCYNPTGATISGTEQVGSIAAATGDVSIDPTKQWWNGPDEDVRYIVAYSSLNSERSNGPERVLATNYPCNLGFIGSSAKTDESFLNLAKTISGSSSLASASAAKTWLNTNGYWTSWVSSVPAFTGLLDTYTGAAAAYSAARRLSSTYTGALIRVRRSSDNTEQDIGYDGSNVLDESALTTFVGSGNNGFVTTWYDQSGNSKNATQTTAANQPQIVSSGSVITQNSKPALLTDGTNDSLRNSLSVANGTTLCTFYSFSKIGNGTNDGYKPEIGINTTSGANVGALHYVNPSNTGAALPFYPNFSWYFTSTNSYSNNTMYLMSVMFPGSSPWKVFNNSVEEASVASAGTIQSDHIGFDIGMQLSANRYSNNKFSEVIFYTSNQNTNRTGIESNINTYYSIYPTDSDAAAFVSAAGITDATQMSAVNTLVTDLKGYGIWTKMKALYPFVGGSATSHKFNLKDPRDLDAAYRLVFNGGWTHSSTGALPNGTNAFADTKLNPSTVLASFNSNHISYYSRTQNLTDSANMGGGSGSAYLTLERSAQWNGNTFLNFATDPTTSLFINTRTANNVQKLYRNGSQLGSTNTTTITISANAALYLGARNIGGGNQYSVRECALASIGDGLNDTEAANFYTAVQTFQTTLGRQV